MVLKEAIGWPSDVYREPRVARFHVPRSSLLDEEYVPGVQVITITETSAEVEDRLKRSSVAYRMAAAVRGLVRASETPDEV